MKIKIGVMGSATEKLTHKQKQKAIELGQAIADKDCIVITGACPGLPHLAAKGAKQKGGLVIGISPGLSLVEHVHKYDAPTKHHDILIYTGSGLMGREVVNIRSSDVVIIIGGRSGTLGEFAIAYDEGKLIGVLQDTGGIADQIDVLLDICRIKDTGAKVITDTDPKKLVARLTKLYQKEFKRHGSIFDDYESKSYLRG
ncbi:MAG: LOG family protein [Deltaproteobacteria bacterium]|nr:LOG family protein [Deltaproteobacteria bacterium]MBI4197328.1 LOG family protein [Deltaproteobacteria bacterium]